MLLAGAPESSVGVMVASGVGTSGSVAGEPRTRLHEVFVSYSSRDKPIADAIVARLEQAGIRCWFAPRDVLPGMNWAQAIVGAIGSTQLMVVVLSGEANRSHQVLREVERAISTGIVVVPFRIEAVEPTDAMAYYLASEHWLDALTPPLDDHIATLVEVVEAFLDRAPDREPHVADQVAEVRDPSLNQVYRAPAVAATTAQPGRRHRLLVAGGILAIAGIVGAIVALTSLAGPDVTGSPEPAADLAADPLDSEATVGDGSSEVETDGSQELLDRLYRDCADGVGASCKRLWFESEGHSDEAAMYEFATSQLWRLSAIERWGIDIPGGSLPTSYGSHAELDRLYDECDAGEEAACTELLWQSPPFSDYVDLASRGFDHRPTSWDTGSLVSYWLVITSAERAYECEDFARGAAGLVAEWQAEGLAGDTVLQFYNDHCGVERDL